MVLAVLAPVCLAVVLWFAQPHLLRRRRIRRLVARCAARRAIVLSYDDGPGAELTPALLDLLARRGARASFYMIGRESLARPATVARVLAGGHEVANHTQEHLNAWKVWPWRALRDLHAGRATLDRLGAAPRSFRPPYGKMTPLTWLATWRSRERIAFWTVDSRDSWEVPLPIPEVLAQIDTLGGGVVLMHDCDCPPRARSGHDHGAHVLALTEAILDMAALRGFAILRLCDLERH